MIFIKRLLLIHLPFTVLLFLFSCQQDREKETQSSPVSGHLKVYADESFKPILEAEEATFEALYPNADVSIEYIPEVKAIEALLNDSVEMVVIGRDITPEEKDFFEESQALISKHHFSTDALAFLLPARFNNSLTSVKELESILSGKFVTWNQLNKKWPEEEITVVFDQSNSSNLNLAIERFDLKPGKVKIFAAGSNQAVAEYVKEHPYAIGVIGAAWISDEESLKAKELREGLSVVALKSDSGEAYTPFQNSVYYENNPFTRKIYIVRRNKNSGLGAGFTSFLQSDKGQRIALKAGILPAYLPGREIVITKEK